jgi:hypothetical protein
MHDNRKIIIDKDYGHDTIDHFADATFTEFDQHDLVLGAVYIIGYRQLCKHADSILNLAANDKIKLIFSHPTEGSSTLLGQCTNISENFLALAKKRKIAFYCGGPISQEYHQMSYETFLAMILDYKDNVNAIQQYNDNYSTVRPYKFLFLNGRARSHRRVMLDNLAQCKLLDAAIWTNLSPDNGPMKLLDLKYEYHKFNVDFDIDDCNNAEVTKDKLFGPGIWGEIYLNSAPYNDTYFSVVTETVHAYPYSFRTEKIWKPIAIGHPWIAVANQGYYKDMHNLGFKTFGHVVDESFDSIENNHDRLERVTAVIKDLCEQDLVSFLKECYNVCKYNQQHLAVMQAKVRGEFSDRFRHFVTNYINE